MHPASLTAGKPKSGPTNDTQVINAPSLWGSSCFPPHHPSLPLPTSLLPQQCSCRGTFCLRTPWDSPLPGALGQGVTAAQHCCPPPTAGSCLGIGAPAPPLSLGQSHRQQGCDTAACPGAEGAVRSGASMGQGLVQAQQQPVKQLSKGSTSSISAPQPLQAVGRRWAHSWSFLEKSLSFQRHPETSNLGAGRMVFPWKEFLGCVSSLA